MKLDLSQIYDELMAYSEARNFIGTDPFDGLNSRLFRITPLRYLSLTRLAWLQLNKRLPFDFRPIFLIERSENSKGIALFLLAEISRARATQADSHYDKAGKLLDRLSALSIKGKSGGASPTLSFGYDFDWQSRAFYVPSGTPTIVPTAFAARAFLEAFELFDKAEFIEYADRICKFIVSDLQRPIETDEEICFSYSPIDSSVIFNASLLAAETLASVAARTGNTEYRELAVRATRFVTRRQRSDGSWAYGTKLRHNWVDNFHTAFVLTSLHRISHFIPELTVETKPVLEKGFSFWVENFFLPDGTPKYFEDKTFPIDIHSAAAAIAALSEFDPIDERAFPLAKKIVFWTASNMRDEVGFFYYQKRRTGLAKIPYMRWGQAWMAYAMARFLETIGRK